MAEKQGQIKEGRSVGRIIGEAALFGLAFLVFGKIWSWANLPAWTGNPIDDLLYYAYDYEKYGWLAFVWRWFIVLCVAVGLLIVLIYLYGFVVNTFKDKSKKVT